MSNASKIIAHLIVGLNDGGAEAALFRLCAGDSLHKHIVISMMDEGKYGTKLKQAGIEVYCLGMLRGQIRFGGVLDLCRVLRSVQPDVLQTWMYHADLLGTLVAKICGVKKLCWGLHHANLNADAVKLKTSWIARACAWLSFWGPDSIVSCSRVAAEVHTEIGYAQDKFVVVPNGVDLSRFTPNSELKQNMKKMWCADKSEFLIGMVARFDPQKDHANFICALGTLKRYGHSIRCLLIGPGMDASNHELTALLSGQNLGDEMVLLGSREDVPNLMNGMDLHVLSSYSEAAPNVLIEAMACGTPCLCTEVGDMPFIVGETGWVVPPKDANALASALLDAYKLYSDQPNEWTKKQTSARERALSHFSLELMRGGYSRVWNS
jgi:glycosyltransferase involved in cell wall biosynthesis